MKKCWYCGQDAMCPYESLGKGWSKCSNCGATDNELLLKRKREKKVKK